MIPTSMTLTPRTLLCLNIFISLFILEIMTLIIHVFSTSQVKHLFSLYVLPSDVTSEKAGNTGRFLDNFQENKLFFKMIVLF